PQQRLVGGEHHGRMGRSQAQHDLGHQFSQSTLILAACATAVHFFSSAAMKAPNSSGVPGLLTAPMRVTVSCMSGAAMAALIVVLSLATMLAGGPAGASEAFDVCRSYLWGAAV